MSSFFRGPSLLTHVVIVATASAVAVPYMGGRTGSWVVTGGAWLAGTVVYVLAALFFASRKPPRAS